MHFLTSILRKDQKINSMHILIVTEEILLVFFFSCVTTGALLKE